MRQMQPVLWTKGVLLTPQHLQVQDRFLEDLLQFQLSALRFAPWGFQRLEIDREALASGQVALTAATGLFADGLPFDCPDPDAAPQPKPIGDAWGADRQWLDVFLAVPEYRDNGFNVGTSPRDGGARYVAEVLVRNDENTGRAAKPIQVARKNLRLLVSGESLEGSSVLPVARVRKNAVGEYQLDAQFVPPLVSVGASDHLITMLRQLVETLSARSSALAGVRRHKNVSVAEYSITDVSSFWLLYTINTHFPRLRHLLDTRAHHPFELFDAMSALAGALTTFSPTIHPRQLPAYDHADPGPGFTELQRVLLELLRTVVPPGFVSLPLQVVRPGVHATAIEQDAYFTAPQLYLAVSAAMPARDLTQKVPHSLKASSNDRVDELVRGALGGLALVYTPNPPSAVQVKTDHHYFQVDRSGDHWTAVMRARNLAVHVPDTFVGAQLELLVVLPPKG